MSLEAWAHLAEEPKVAGMGAGNKLNVATDKSITARFNGGLGALSRVFLRGG